MLSKMSKPTIKARKAGKHRVYTGFYTQWTVEDRADAVQMADFKTLSWTLVFTTVYTFENQGLNRLQTVYRPFTLDNK